MKKGQNKEAENEKRETERGGRKRRKKLRKE